MDVTILIVDDEESIRYTFNAFFSKEGYHVLEAEDFKTACKIIKTTRLDVIFSDILLKEFNGIDLLRIARKEQDSCPVIMITGQPDLETAGGAVRLGAFDYLIKPIEKETIVKVAKMALNFKQLEDEKRRIANENIKYRKNLEAIFRSVSEAIVTFDYEGVILNANDATLKVCGVSPKEIIGKKIPDILHLSSFFHAEVFQSSMDMSAKGRKCRYSFRIGNNERKNVVINVSPLIDTNDNMMGTVVAVRDETKLASLEKELKERYSFHRIVGKSKAMQRIYTLIENLSEMDTTVLITGESGTGKELVAGALHHNGARSEKPFICLNCSALSENLLESELFGHVKGAFTGAIKDKKGRFHYAHGGTLFLDEIGDISPMIQLKLLRVLQEKQFERVGDSTPVKIDVRIIAATNKDLPRMIRDGRFREDLFYRLKVVELNIPPLRERLEDIPLLSNHFIKKFNSKFKKQIQDISDEALHVFMAYSWPGNVREMEHSIEHAFVLCREEIITPDHLPAEISKISAGPRPVFAEKNRSVSDQQIMQMLEQTRWNKARTARKLGISRQTLYRRMKKNDFD